MLCNLSHTKWRAHPYSWPWADPLRPLSSKNPRTPGRGLTFWRAWLSVLGVYTGCLWFQRKVGRCGGRHRDGRCGLEILLPPCTPPGQQSHGLDYGKLSSKDPGNSSGWTLWGLGSRPGLPTEQRALASAPSSPSLLGELEGLGKRYTF